MGGKSLNNQQNFKFNVPDFSEIGTLVNSVRKLHEDVADIKKSLANGGSVSNSSNAETSSSN